VRPAHFAARRSRSGSQGTRRSTSLPRWEIVVGCRFASKPRPTDPPRLRSSAHSAHATARPDLYWVGTRSRGSVTFAKNAMACSRKLAAQNLRDDDRFRSAGLRHGVVEVRMNPGRHMKRRFLNHKDAGLGSVCATSVPRSFGSTGRLVNPPHATERRGVAQDLSLLIFNRRARQEPVILSRLPGTTPVANRRYGSLKSCATHGRNVRPKRNARQARPSNRAKRLGLRCPGTALGSDLD
jgi:hypothetical protein